MPPAPYCGRNTSQPKLLSRWKHPSPLPVPVCWHKPTQRPSDAQSETHSCSWENGIIFHLLQERTSEPTCVCMGGEELAEISGGSRRELRQLRETSLWWRSSGKRDILCLWLLRLFLNSLFSYEDVMKCPWKSILGLHPQHSDHAAVWVSDNLLRAQKGYLLPLWTAASISAGTANSQITEPLLRKRKN